MLYKETVGSGTLALIKDLQSKEFLKDFYLVGGTALALFMGHRKSIDIDLFAVQNFNSEELVRNLRNHYDFSIEFQKNYILTVYINNIKVDFVDYKYDLIQPPVLEDGIKMLSKEDISAMKINAIAGDGTRLKDFIDIYFLLKEMSFTEIISCYKNKYKQDSDFHAIKSLGYFNDIDASTWPEMIREKDLTIKMITDTILKARSEYLNTYC